MSYQTETNESIQDLQQALEQRRLSSEEANNVFKQVEQFHQNFQRTLSASTHTPKDTVRVYNL